MEYGRERRDRPGQRTCMKMNAKLIACLITLGLPLTAGILADQPLGSGELPPDCALAASPRALQIFPWLVCASERRSVWASSERPRDPDRVAPPRALQQLPMPTIVPPPAAPVVSRQNIE